MTVLSGWVKNICGWSVRVKLSLVKNEQILECFFKGVQLVHLIEIFTQ